MRIAYCSILGHQYYYTDVHTIRYVWEFCSQKFKYVTPFRIRTFNQIHSTLVTLLRHNYQSYYITQLLEDIFLFQKASHTHIDDEILASRMFTWIQLTKNIHYGI